MTAEKDTITYKGQPPININLIENYFDDENVLNDDSSNYVIVFMLLNDDMSTWIFFDKRERNLAMSLIDAKIELATIEDEIKAFYN